MDHSPQAIFSKVDEIVRQYGVGDLVGIERNERGTVNTNFELEIAHLGERKKYFLRRYKKSIKPLEIEFEHSIIQWLIKKEVTFIAQVYSSVNNQTFIMAQDTENLSPVYYALFDYLPGEDKYTWVNPHCSRRECHSAAQILAQFHQATADLTPSGYRSEARIVELLPAIAENIAQVPSRSKGTIFDQYLLKHAEWISREIDVTHRTLIEASSWGLPNIIIHCDFHPGNLKFSEDRVVGLLDFDWSKIDLRVFDFALAIWYFFTDWEEPEEGRLRMDEVMDFISIYQKTLSDIEKLQPLSTIEFELLPILLKASSLYILNWALDDYYSKSVDPIEYLGYLKHNVRSLQWLNLTNFPVVPDWPIDEN
jgi:homoserine kinase type II